MNALFLAVVLMVCIYSIESAIVLRAKRSDNKRHAIDVLKGGRKVANFPLTRTHDGDDNGDIHLENLDEQPEPNDDFPKKIHEHGRPRPNPGNEVNINGNPGKNDKVEIKNEFENDHKHKGLKIVQNPGTGNIYITNCTVVINTQKLLKK